MFTSTQPVSWPDLSQYQSLKIRRTSDFVYFRSAVRRILKLRDRGTVGCRVCLLVTTQVCGGSGLIEKKILPLPLSVCYKPQTIKDGSWNLMSSPNWLALLFGLVNCLPSLSLCQSKEEPTFVLQSLPMHFRPSSFRKKREKAKSVLNSAKTFQG